MNRRKFLRRSSVLLAGLPLVLGHCGNGSGGPFSQSESSSPADSKDPSSPVRDLHLPGNWITLHEARLKDSDLVLLATLQGLVSKTETDRIWIQTQSWVNWNDYLSQEYLITFQREYSVFRVLNIFRSLVRGYILYDVRRNPASRNTAVSLCGPFDAVAVDRSIESQVLDLKIGKLMDVRNKGNEWALQNYGPLLNRNLVIQQDPTASRGMLSDFAVYRKALAFHEGVDQSFQRNALSTQNVGGLMLGWQGCEFDFFIAGSVKGSIPVPAVDMPNLSVLDQMPTGPLTQPNGIAEFPFEPDAHYLAFVVVDGDNIEWYYHMFATPNWWGHRIRGRTAINWEISPTLYSLASPIMKYFYQNASDKDYFVCSSSGQGSVFPDRYPDLPGYLANLDPLLRDSDLSVVSVYQPDSLELSSVSDFTKLSSVEGVIFKTYLGNYHLAQGVVFQNEVPIKSCDFSLWLLDDTGETLAPKINLRPRDPRNDPQSYTIVAVHPWTPNVMDEVEKAVGLFHSKVRVVTCGEMFYHLRHNFDRARVGVNLCQNLPSNIQLPPSFFDTARTRAPSCKVLLDPCQFGNQT